MADFKTASRRQDDLLTEAFAHSNFFALKLDHNGGNGIKFTSNLTQGFQYTPVLSTVQSGDLTLKYNSKQVNVEEKLNTRGNQETLVEYNLGLKDLQRSIIYANTKSTFSNAIALNAWRAGLTIQRRDVTNTTEVEELANKDRFAVNKNTVIVNRNDEKAGNTTYGFDTILSYNLNKNIFSIPRAAAWLYQRNLTLLLASEIPQRGPLGLNLVHASLFNRLNEKYSVAARVQQNFQNNTTTFQVAGEARPYDNLTVTARVDQNFNLSAALAVQVNRWIRLVFSNNTALNPQAAAKDAPTIPLGVRVEINSSQ